jgi:AcrR family transcriptional regulator
MAGRILDAAFLRFAAQGISRTKISEIAADVGISRMWLYRHFANRDDIVRAMLARETQRFVDGVVAVNRPGVDPVRIVTDGFVYCAEFLCGHELLQRLLETEPDALRFLTTEGGPLYEIAVAATAAFLIRRAGRRADDARDIAETLTRLMVSIVLTRRTLIDFGDPAGLRAYAASIVPRLLG